jgi:alpha-ribazole phosphatase
MVRHGETELNSAVHYWGYTDVGLNALGLKQAGRLRERLAAERIDAIYSSNLKRARLTAEIIAARYGLPVVTCPELREVDFGVLEGLTFEEISSAYPDVAERWISRDPSLEYPGGESNQEFTGRVASFLPRLEAHDTGSSILIVAHSGVLRTLICQLMGVGTSFRWRFRLDLASLSIMETYPAEAILTLLNDVSHLA